MMVEIGDYVQYTRGHRDVRRCRVVKIERVRGTLIVWGRWFSKGETQKNSFLTFLNTSRTSSFKVLSKPTVDKEYEEMSI